MSNLLRRRGIGSVLALFAAIALTACSSPSEVASDSGTSSEEGGDSSDEAQEALQVAYEGEMGTPPTESTTPKSGVKVWVVSCGEQIPSCAAPTAAVAEAAEAAGWTPTVCDGQLNPEGWNNCLRQGISAGVDVIIPIGLDCPRTEQAYQEARDAGITVIGGGGVDCDSVGGEKLWASETLQLEGRTAEETWNFVGQLGAEYLIGKTDGQAKVLQLIFTDAVWGPWIAEGFEARMADCADCEVTPLEYSNAEVGGGTLPQKFSTALLADPQLDSVFIPVGGILPAGLSQAIQASGRSDELTVLGGLGSGANLDLIRSDGGQDAMIGYPVEWGGWGAVDTAIRVLNGEEPQYQGNGYQVVDAENNMPDGPEFSGGVDFRAAYQEAWGV